MTQDEKDLGFIVIPRYIFDTPIFLSAGLLQLFLLLVRRAAYADKKIPWRTGKGHTTLSIKRGQLIVGRNSLANALGIPASTARDRLAKLVAAGYIDVHPDNHFSTVSIRNYDDFRIESFDQRQGSRQPIRHKEVSSSSTDAGNGQSAGAHDSDTFSSLYADSLSHVGKAIARYWQKTYLQKTSQPYSITDKEIEILNRIAASLVDGLSGDESRAVEVAFGRIDVFFSKTWPGKVDKNVWNIGMFAKVHQQCAAIPQDGQDKKQSEQWLNLN